MGKKALIASFGLNENFYAGKTQEQMIPEILDKTDSVAGYRPDMIVFPEIFLKIGGDRDNPNWEAVSGEMLRRLQERARQIGCYIVAPVYKRVAEHPELRYNDTVLIDRQGGIACEYRKVHTVVSESEVSRVLPGSEYTVYDTDFGRVGFQTCFDIGWRDGWKALADLGARLVIWTAAYDGGNLLNTYAAHNMYYVVSSVRTWHSQIIDLTGRTIAEGARWNGLAMTRIDLETTLFHIDDQYQKIDGIRRDLGDRVTIRAYSEENVFTVESNDEAWPISRICEVYGLKTYQQYHEEATRVQEAWRKRYPV